MALFLDDTQWADEAYYRLLSKMTEDLLGCPNFLLVAAS